MSAVEMELQDLAMQCWDNAEFGAIEVFLGMVLAIFAVLTINWAIIDLAAKGESVTAANAGAAMTIGALLMTGGGWLTGRIVFFSYLIVHSRYDNPFLYWSVMWGCIFIFAQGVVQFSLDIRDPVILLIDL
ncbi:hypothetical protein [Stappia indica]|uniref:hypothetical protein n=1 Tax=Stappia indica TaxID=538381 RepID=UPI001CD741EC|nr:hypothetical protein [Stappia indica]MCA1297830.1 hypothetical protein [Stappia indica]